MYRRTAFAAILLAACNRGTAEPPPIVVARLPSPAANARVPVEIRPSSTEPSPVVNEPPPPPADFTSLADVVAAGVGAMGKMVRLRVRRGYTTSTDFVGEPCLEAPPSTQLVLRYAPGQRDAIRAMAPPTNACAAVSFRIVELRGIGVAAIIDGSIEHVGEAKPRTSAPPPPGADYTSIDDAILDGPDAKGKIIAGKFWIDRGTPNAIRVRDCIDRPPAVVVVVSKTPAQQARADQLLENRCGPAHLRVVDPELALRSGSMTMKQARAEVISVP